MDVLVHTSGRSTGGALREGEIAENWELENREPPQNSKIENGPASTGNR